MIAMLLMLLHMLRVPGAQEINTLRQQLADGTVEEADGMEQLRQLEQKVRHHAVGRHQAPYPQD